MVIGSRGQHCPGTQWPLTKGWFDSHIQLCFQCDKVLWHCSKGKYFLFTKDPSDSGFLSPLFQHYTQERAVLLRLELLMFTLFWHCQLRDDNRPRTHCHIVLNAVWKKKRTETQVASCQSVACCQGVALLWMPSWSFCYVSAREAGAHTVFPQDSLHLLLLQLL